jgi:protein Mpv17
MVGFIGRRKAERRRADSEINRFIFLGNHFNYPSKILSLTAKVTINQLAFTPIFSLYFFGMQSFLSGDKLPEIWERIQLTVPVSFINSCKLWPAVTAFSFAFIGPHYRSIFAGVIAIGWQTYLSYLNRKAEAEGRDRAKVPSVPNKKDGEGQQEGEKVCRVEA